MQKKDGFLSFIKGVITGIGSLIPGVSSGSLIISLSSYETFIGALKNIFKKQNKKLSLVAIPLLLGIIAGLIGGAHLVTYFLDTFKMQTIFLFIGLIAGGYMLIVRNQKIKNTKKRSILFLIIFILTIIVNILLLQKVLVINSPKVLTSSILGILTGLSIVIPGFSASNFYTLIGKYEYIMDSLKNYSEVTSILICLVFILSILISMILIAKLMHYLLSKYKETTYVIISALMSASVVIALLQLGDFTANFVNIFTSILAFLWGFILAKNVEKE